jgi:hypothetical protein
LESTDDFLECTDTPDFMLTSERNEGALLRELCVRLLVDLDVLDTDFLEPEDPDIVDLLLAETDLLEPEDPDLLDLLF